MDNGRTWTIDGHGQWSDMDNGRAWTSLRFLAPGCWLARARVYRTHQITPDERRAPRSRPLTREQSAALRVRAHTRSAPCSVRLLLTILGLPNGCRKRTWECVMCLETFPDPFPYIHPPLSTCGGAQRSSRLLKLEPTFCLRFLQGGWRRF